MTLSVEQWIDFAEAGNQQRIILANGTSYQGWIMEISEEALLISTGYSDKVGKDFCLKFQDLQDAELYFWDTQNDDWQPFLIK
ncbi:MULTISPECIES: hypothetical protein [unclassified Acinetobacter]|uniref:hypothetical protein n=1 Tax=unclassified Acinetobacter TaxID=196816 RepID=UPI0035B71F10